MTPDELAQRFGIKSFELADVLTTYSAEMLINMWHELNFDKRITKKNHNCVLCHNCSGCKHCYRCYNCVDCRQCLFCDNLTGTRYMLFNTIQLKAKHYNKIKTKINKYTEATKREEC